MEIFIIVLVLFMFHFGARINTLEREVKRLGAGLKTSETVASSEMVQSVTSTESYSTEVPVPPAPINTQPSWFESFVIWMKEDWLLKLGALIFIFGFGLFLVLVGSELGEFGRITLSLIVGTCVLLFGFVRMFKFVRQGGVFLVLGSIIITLTTFTATYGYHIFPAEVSLIVTLLTSAFVALASVRYRILSMAVTGLILASFAPTLLLEGVNPQYVELFAYLFIVSLGVVWVVALTGWRVLNLMSLIVFTLYSLPHIALSFFGNNQASELLFYAYAFILLFFTVNTIGILKAKEGDIKSDSVSAGWNGVLLLMWVMTGVSQDWKSLVIVGWMLLFIVVAFAIFAITKRKEPFFVYTGVGIMMLVTATAVELNGIGLVIALIAESAVLPLISYLIVRDRKISERLCALTIGPALLSLPSMFVNWNSGIPFDHFFVLLLMSIVFFLLGIFFVSIPKNENDNSNTSGVLFVVGSFFAYVLLWLSLHAEMPEVMANMFSLTIYAIIGFIAYAYGKRNDSRPVAVYGSALLTFVAGYLIFVGLVAGIGIFIFFIVGAILMATAFIGRKKHTDTPQV